jgi:hypothetical protein
MGRVYPNDRRGGRRSHVEIVKEEIAELLTEVGAPTYDSGRQLVESWRPRAGASAMADASGAWRSGPTALERSSTGPGPKSRAQDQRSGALLWPAARGLRRG